MAGILHLKETGKTPKQTIDEIVLGDKFRAYDKAKLLGGHRLVCELGGDAAGAKLFADAEAGQRIYMILHDAEPGKRYANAYQKIRALASGKFSPAQMRDAIVWDGRLSAQEKAAYLGELRKKSPMLKRELTEAYRGQNAFLVKMKGGDGAKNAAPPRMEGGAEIADFVPERKTTLTAKALLKLPEVAGYAALAGKQGRPQAWIEKKLEERLDEIEHDAERYYAVRGGFFEFDNLRMWGPSLEVSRKVLTGEIAANYLCSENTGLPVELLHAIVGQECAWNPNASGTTHGLSNGTGPFQITGMTEGDVEERLELVNSKLAAWGYLPIGKDIGLTDAKRGRREPLVLVQTTVQVGKGKKKKDKRVSVPRQELGRARRPDERFARNGAVFRRELTDYAKALRMATAVLILKGAHPDMTSEEMRGVGERYNANPAPVRTPDGKYRPTFVVYGGKIKARADWSRQP